MCHVPPLVHPGDLLSSRTDTTGDGKSLWFLRWTYRWTCALEIIGGVYEADVRYQKFSSLCYPAQQAMQTKFKNCWQRRWGSVPESGAYRPVLMICFLSKQFSSKGKSLNPSTEIWKSTTLYWRDLVTVCRQKKADVRFRADSSGSEVRVFIERGNYQHEEQQGHDVDILFIFISIRNNKGHNKDMIYIDSNLLMAKQCNHGRCPVLPWTCSVWKWGQAHTSLWCPVLPWTCSVWEWGQAHTSS